jgi:hypothetical protein
MITLVSRESLNSVESLKPGEKSFFLGGKLARHAIFLPIS